MAYPNIPTEKTEKNVRDFLINLGERKEFYMFAKEPALKPNTQPAINTTPASKTQYFPGVHIEQYHPEVPYIPGLRLSGGQLFVRNFNNPDTPYQRLLLEWQTGSGKTIALIVIANQYVKQFRLQRGKISSERPTVFIIGFTKRIIQEEMLRWPELGFISLKEAEELRRLRLIAEKGGEDESRHLGGYIGSLKRRITDRTRGGYYRFYGYKEFANTLFTLTRKGLAEKLELQKIYEQSLKDEGASLEDRLKVEIKSGKIRLNEDLLDDMRNGFLACDEIHNTYNIQTKNNYGIAIQYALDVLGKEAPRALFMSATPMSGSATEIVDLLNFLVPKDFLPNKKPFLKKDFFKLTPRTTSSLLPGAEEKIGLYSSGRVSFLLDTGIEAYPRRIFEGVSLSSPLDGSEISYLKFTPCPMSPFHQRTLFKVIEELTTKALMPGAQTLYDMAFPNPDYDPYAPAEKSLKDPSHGLYLSINTIPKISAASSGWKKTAGVQIEKTESSEPALVIGEFLKLGPGGASRKRVPNRPLGLAYYSSKFSRIAADIIHAIKSGAGKIMVYHHRVRMSGVLLLGEILRENGLTDEFSTPTARVICAICGVPKKDHKPKVLKTTNAKAHDYVPARFILAHYYIDRSSMERSITRFNSPANTEGYRIRVLVGSKIIREGYNFKAVRWQFVASLPTDIPTLIQVFGRVARKNSHIDLPEEERTVTFRIYVTTENPELIRYSIKMKEYGVIQRVERCLRRYAIDAFANYGPLVEARPTLQKGKGDLDTLPYKPAVSFSDVTSPSGPKLDSFEAYGYSIEETKLIEAILRSLFRVRAVWTYDELLKAVKTPGYVKGISVNPSYFSEENFAFALQRLATMPKYQILTATSSSDQEEAVGSQVVYIPVSQNGTTKTKLSGYYMLVPVTSRGIPIVDIESYVRKQIPPKLVRIKVNEYLRGGKLERNFEMRLQAFEQRFSDSSVSIELALVQYGEDFHYFLLEALTEAIITGEGTLAKRINKKALNRVIDVYKRFKIAVTVGDILRKPKAKALFRGGHTAGAFRFGLETMVGYVMEDSVSLYNPYSVIDGSPPWYRIPLGALEIGRRYTENDTVVGWMECKSGTLKFKMRTPLHNLEREKIRDLRLLARGAICETRPRSEQECIACQLKAMKKKELIGATAGELCVAIRNRLLILEEKARAGARGMKKGIRWFYLFNDLRPTITLVYAPTESST